MSPAPPTPYDVIGNGYAAVRREDPRISARLRSALAGCRSLVNVGAGAGSYEPADMDVVAVEPSRAMMAQRTRPARRVRAWAKALPLLTGCADAALAVLTVHHWDNLAAGLDELKRVARRRVVVLTWDPAYARILWMNREYFPAVAAVDERRFPALESVQAALPGARVETVEIPRDCTDGFYGAYWARPAAYLEPRVRAGISCLRQLPEPSLRDGLCALERDLANGLWHERHAALLQQDALDLGYRIVTWAAQGWDA